MKKGNNIMEHTTLGQLYLKELDDEAPASRKFIERIPMSLKDYKPHERSMAMGYLTLLVAEIPKWIAVMAEGGEIDFATWKHIDPKSAEELVKHFDENMKAAKKALQKISDEDMARPFELKNNGAVVFSSPTKDFIGSTINHLVHHRGQLTVYMRLNDIKVPSTYGPSADDKGF
jgi:uncharacterized damage-inducible protein DinB